MSGKMSRGKLKVGERELSSLQRKLFFCHIHEWPEKDKRILERAWKEGVK